MPHRIHANVASVVGALADRGNASVTSLSGEVGLPAATVRRIGDGLVAAGLAELDAEGRLSLTTRWLHLAESFRRTGHGWPGAHEVLQELSVRTGLTAYFVVPDGEVALCLDWAPGRGTGLPELRPGGVRPLFAGAGGRMALAHAVVDVEGYLAGAPFAAVTPSSLGTAQALREDVALTRASGYVLADEDVAVGVACLGVPVRAGGRYLGALSVGGPREEVLDRLAGHLLTLRGAVSSIDG